MGRYPGDDEEKAERQRQRDRERTMAEERASDQRRQERAERSARARAAWDKAGGAEQTRMLLAGLSRLLGWTARGTWRWLFKKRNTVLRDGDGRLRDWFVFSIVGVVVAGFCFGMAVLNVWVTRLERERDAPKCRAVYERIAAAPDDLTYRKARTLLGQLSCTHAAVPEPARIEELMGGD